MPCLCNSVRNWNEMHSGWTKLIVLKKDIGTPKRDPKLIWGNPTNDCGAMLVAAIFRSQNLYAFSGVREKALRDFYGPSQRMQLSSYVRTVGIRKFQKWKLWRNTRDVSRENSVAILTNRQRCALDADICRSAPKSQTTTKTSTSTKRSQDKRLQHCPL